MPTLESPTVILFDWHATLVDTLDAVYHAIDDMLANIVDLDTCLPNVEQNDSNKFYFMCRFNKLQAPVYSLPPGGGRGRVGLSVA